MTCRVTIYCASLVELKLEREERVGMAEARKGRAEMAEAREGNVEMAEAREVRLVVKGY